MKRSEKAEKIAVMLEELYPETPVPLDHENAFQLLVAVLMSAQTTDLKVNEVTPALFAKAPNAKAMAQLPVEVILAAIRQVGLAPTKAKKHSRALRTSHEFGRHIAENAACDCGSVNPVARRGTSRHHLFATHPVQHEV